MRDIRTSTNVAVAFHAPSGTILGHHGQEPKRLDENYMRIRE